MDALKPQSFNLGFKAPVQNQIFPVPKQNKIILTNPS